MKAQRITIKRINQRTHYLPDDAKNNDLLLWRIDKNGMVVEEKHFHCFSEMLPHVLGFTHYIILPRSLYP